MGEILQLIITILAGMATAIPLVIKLTQTVSAYVQEKNWGQLVQMVTKFMSEAEGKFKTGAEKKQYVMEAIQAAAVTINYNLTDEDLQKISQMIDNLCDMSKIVNVRTKTKAKQTSKEE